jgi:hypothetical protein
LGVIVVAELRHLLITLQEVLRCNCIDCQDMKYLFDFPPTFAFARTVTDRAR